MVLRTSFAVTERNNALADILLAPVIIAVCAFYRFLWNHIVKKSKYQNNKEKIFSGLSIEN